MSWQIILYFVIIASGIVTGAIRFLRLSRSSTFFFFLLIATFFVELSAWFAAKYYGNNLWIYRPFIFLQFGLIVSAFYQELTRYRKWLWISVFVVITAGVTDLFVNSNQLSTQYPTAVKSLICVLICLWTLVFLRELLHTPKIDSFTSYPLFWFSIGWLLFSVITLVSFSAHNYIGVSKEGFISFFYTIRMAGNLVLYSLFIVAFLSHQQQI